VSEQFTAVVAVGGSRFYSFTTSTYGTINATLDSVSGDFVPATVMVNLGIGQPSGTDCLTTTSLNTASGSSVQVTGAFEAGVYCVKVTDIGNLYGPAAATVTVAYP
jgi:hypothetical protein